MSAHRERLTVAAVIALTAAVIVACFAPGRMNVDTLYQLNEISTGDFTNQHAPVLEAIWKPFYDLGIGPGAVLFAQVLAFLVGGYLVLRVAFRPIPSALAVAAISFFPPVFLMLGTLMRDTWFTALLVLTAGLAIRAVQAEPRHRTAWLVGVAFAVWLTLAARQNAAPALAPICIVLVYLLLAKVSPTWKRVATATGAAVLGLGLMIGSLALFVKAIDARDINPEQYLYIYDVGAASIREEENLFPPDVMAQRDFEPIEQAWTVDNVIPLIFGTDALVVPPLAPEAFDSLREAWLDQLSSDPLGYLGSRMELFAHQLSFGAEPVLVAAEETAFGYAHWFQSANDVANDYLAVFTRADQDFFIPLLFGGVLFTVWVYLLAAIGAAVALVRRGTPAPVLLAGALALSALTLQAGLFFGAMGVAYRFEFSVVAVALLTVPVAVVAVRRGREVPAPSSASDVREAPQNVQAPA